VAASGQLKSAGYNVTLKIYPNVGHTISSEQARDALHGDGLGFRLEFLRSGPVSSALDQRHLRNGPEYLQGQAWQQIFDHF